MKWIMTILFIVLIAPAAFGQYAFQVTTERDVNGICINWQDITADVSYELSPDTTKKVYADTPDKTALDKDDLQEWFVDADVDGFYLVSFSFAGIGLMIPNNTKYREYWFRYSKDSVLYSDSDAVVVMKPGKPGHK